MFLTAISCDMPRSVSSLLMNNCDSYVAAIKCDIGDSGDCGVVVFVCCFRFLIFDGDGDSNDGDGDSDVKTDPPTASLLRLSAPPLALGSCQ